jgi:hypothetical protein
MDSSTMQINKRPRVRINWEPNCLLLDFAKNGELDRIKDLFSSVAAKPTTNTLATDHNNPAIIANAEYGEDMANEITPRNSPTWRKMKVPLTRSYSGSGSSEPLSVNYHAAYTGLTPLHMACAYGHLPVVRYLIEQQHADWKVRDREGWTILHSLISEIPMIPGTVLTVAAAKSPEITATTASSMRPTVSGIDVMSLNRPSSGGSTKQGGGTQNAVASLRRQREQFLELLRYLLASLPQPDLLTAITDEGDTVLDCIKETDDGVVDETVLAIVKQAMQERGIDITELTARADRVKETASNSASMDTGSEDGDDEVMETTTTSDGGGEQSDADSDDDNDDK